MKRLLCLQVLAVSLLLPRVSQAQLPLGTVVATFVCTPSKVLADPVRSRIYVTDTGTNDLLVIDTTTLQKVATVPVGSDPVDMAISLDGNTLYVANNGSTAAAVTVVDLNALTLRTTFALPGAPEAIAAGLGGRVYVSSFGNDQDAIYQLDGTTGAVQTSFNADYYDNNLFQISPDGKTLFVASKGIEPGSLKSFDVSTAMPVALQTNGEASENDSQLVISHNGKYLCLPSGGGNAVSGGYNTYLFATADINSHYGAFSNGLYPGPLAFSPDDSLVYQNFGDEDELQIFSTQSFTKLNEISYPGTGSEYGDSVASITTDNTGSYLCIGEQGMVANAQGQFSYIGQLIIISTGTGTLTPPPPVVTLAASVPSVVDGTGQVGAFALTLSSAPFADVHVTYSVKGTAANGQDYVFLKGTAKVKAGKTTKEIKVTPQGDLGGAAKKTVVLTLQPGAGYAVGTTSKVKVKILAPMP